MNTFGRMEDKYRCRDVYKFDKRTMILIYYKKDKQTQVSIGSIIGKKVEYIVELGNICNPDYEKILSFVAIMVGATTREGIEDKRIIKNLEQDKEINKLSIGVKELLMTGEIGDEVGDAMFKYVTNTLQTSKVSLPFVIDEIDKIGIFNKDLQEVIISVYRERSIKYTESYDLYVERLLKEGYITEEMIKPQQTGKKGRGKEYEESFDKFKERLTRKE